MMSEFLDFSFTFLWCLQDFIKHGRATSDSESSKRIVWWKQKPSITVRADSEFNVVYSNAHVRFESTGWKYTRVGNADLTPDFSVRDLRHLWLTYARSTGLFCRTFAAHTIIACAVLLEARWSDRTSALDGFLVFPIRFKIYAATWITLFVPHSTVFASSTIQPQLFPSTNSNKVLNHEQTKTSPNFDRTIQVRHLDPSE